MSHSSSRVAASAACTALPFSKAVPLTRTRGLPSVSRTGDQHQGLLVCRRLEKCHPCARSKMSPMKAVAPTWHEFLFAIKTSMLWSQAIVKRWWRPVMRVSSVLSGNGADGTTVVARPEPTRRTRSKPTRGEHGTTFAVSAAAALEHQIEPDLSLAARAPVERTGPH